MKYRPQVGLLSHQMEIRVARGMTVSHDLLMHLRLDRFVRQPHLNAGVSWRSISEARRAAARQVDGRSFERFRLESRDGAAPARGQSGRRWPRSRRFKRRCRS